MEENYALDQFGILLAHRLGSSLQTALLRFSRNTKVQVQVSFIIAVRNVDWITFDAFLYYHSLTILTSYAF